MYFRLMYPKIQNLPEPVAKTVEDAAKETSFINYNYVSLQRIFFFNKYNIDNIGILNNNFFRTRANIVEL